MIRKLLFILSFVVLSVSWWAAPVAAANYTLTRELLVNGGFEQDANWQAFGNGGNSYVTDVKHGGARAVKVVSNVTGQMFGAYQRVDLNQTERMPVNLTGWVKGQNIVNGPGGYFGAALYAEIHLNDGTVAYWNTIINTGTFDWRPVGFSIGNLPAVNKPISHIFVVTLVGNATGTAWFDDLHLTEYRGTGAAVTFMFDDGEDSVMLAKNILTEKRFKASTPIPTNHIDQPGFVTKAQVKELINAGWEMMSHGVSHEDLTQMSLVTLRNELRRPISYFQRQFGITIKGIAWPFGAYNGTVIQEAVAAGYRSGRAYELSNTGAATLPFDTKVRSLEQGVTGATVSGWLNEARANHQWVVLVGHKVAATGDDKYFVTEAQLREIVSAVAASGLPVLTFDQGLDAFATNISSSVVPALLTEVVSTPTPSVVPGIGGTTVVETGSAVSVSAAPTVILTPTLVPSVIESILSLPDQIQSDAGNRIESLMNKQRQNRINL